MISSARHFRTVSWKETNRDFWESRNTFAVWLLVSRASGLCYVNHLQGLTGVDSFNPFTVTLTPLKLKDRHR